MKVQQGNVKYIGTACLDFKMKKKSNCSGYTQSKKQTTKTPKNPFKHSLRLHYDFSLFVKQIISIVLIIFVNEGCVAQSLLSFMLY